MGNFAPLVRCVCVSDEIAKGSGQHFIISHTNNCNNQPPICTVFANASKTFFPSPS